MEELKVFVERIKTLGGSKSFNFLYLEGYILHREGYPRKAIKKINQSINMVEGHFEEFHLACRLYEDGFFKQSIKLFQTITSCGCQTSDSLTESIIGLLAAKDDRKNAFNICKIAEESLLWDNYFIADMLHNYKQPLWAFEYTTRLIKQEDADEDDHFLHLLVLNDIGNSRDTIQYASELLKEAEDNDDEGSIYGFKRLIKQIKTRGKFKLPDE